MRAFKQRARLAQHQWALAQGITSFGTHRNSAQRIAAGGVAQVANGTKLTDADADAGRNFLSDDIRRAVDERLAAPQEGETLSSAGTSWSTRAPTSASPTLAAATPNWSHPMTPRLRISRSKTFSTRPSPTADPRRTTSAPATCRSRPP